MKLSRDLRITLIDYPKLIALELFTIGCNYSCPTCHAKSLLDEESITGEETIQLVKHYPNLDMTSGIVICGGEPTINSDLPEFLEKLRNFKIEIKLDTNGSNPEMLKEILERKLADYIAMDVKGSKELYERLTKGKADIEKVERSMKIAQEFPDYEFRTTVVPVRTEKGYSWMSVEDATSIVKWVSQIIGITGRKNHKHYLQKFVARSKEEMLDERFAKENLPQEYHETPKNLLEAMLDAGKKVGYDFRLR